MRPRRRLAGLLLLLVLPLVAATPPCPGEVIDLPDPGPCPQPELMALDGEPAGADPVDAQALASPEPSGEETLALELLNRFRAHPAAEAELVLDQAQSLWGLFEDVDTTLFASEMHQLEPVQPLVFDLRLIAAARSHSRYCLLNGQCHEEERGKPGFTGETNRERAAAAGFTMRQVWAEDVFRDARSIIHSHCAFLVDRGPGGSGGMQPGRGHRRNMSQPGVRLAGIGAVPGDGGCSVTHEFSGSPGRFIGGVVFIDAAGDHQFAPGSGCAGAVITGSDGSRASSWSSGAYTLPVRGHDVTLTATWRGLSVSAALGDSSDNQHWNWVIEPEQLLAEVRRCAEAAGPRAGQGGQSGQDEPALKRRARAQIALCVAAEVAPLDQGLQVGVANLAGNWPFRLHEAEERVLRAVDRGGAGCEAVISAQAAPFAGTAAAYWFEEARAAKAAITGFTTKAGTAPAAPSVASTRELMEALTQALDGMSEPVWRQRVIAAYNLALVPAPAPSQR